MWECGCEVVFYGKVWQIDSDLRYAKWIWQRNNEDMNEYKGITDFWNYNKAAENRVHFAGGHWILDLPWALHMIG